MELGYDAAIGTARTYILIAIVITFFAVVFWVVFGLLLAIVYGLAAFVPAAIAFLVAILIYLTTYDRLSIGDFAGARGPCLVWGIVDLFFGLGIAGILLLLAHSKLSDVRAGGYTGSLPYVSTTGHAQPTQYGPFRGTSGGRICFGCGSVVPMGSTTCPRCGKLQQ